MVSFELNFSLHGHLESVLVTTSCCGLVITTHLYELGLKLGRTTTQGLKIVEKKTFRFSWRIILIRDSRNTVMWGI